MPCPLDTLRACLDEALNIHEIADETNALNGLQIDATTDSRRDIERVALSVDASEAAIDEAIAMGADLLLVHHGIFWGGHRPLTGAYGRKVKKCFAAGLSLYAAHLPLDVHPTLGNNAGLVQALGLTPTGPFGSHRGVAIGLAVNCDLGVDELVARCASALGTVRRFGRGPERIRRLAIVTGGGGSCLKQAAREGFDALLTGESAHHTALDAEEAGLHLLLGGHYRTETFGVRALGALLVERFGLEARFIEHDTGL